MYLHTTIQFLQILQWSGSAKVWYLGRRTQKKTSANSKCCMHSNPSISLLYQISEASRSIKDVFLNCLPTFFVYNYLFLRRGTDEGKKMKMVAKVPNTHCFSSKKRQGHLQGVLFCVCACNELQG